MREPVWLRQMPCAPAPEMSPAGTSIFAMAVLEKRLRRCIREIDIVTTPERITGSDGTL